MNYPNLFKVNRSLSFLPKPILLFLSLLCNIHLSQAQCLPAPAIPQTQGFNTSGNNALPTCWLRTVVVAPGTIANPALTFRTATVAPSFTSAPYEGTRMVRFNSYDCDPGSQIRLESLPVNTTSATSVDVQFQWLHDNTDYTAEMESVQVQYSFNGTTWVNAGLPIYRVNGPSGASWSLKTVTLPSPAAGQTTLYVGFLFTGDYGLDCYMDAVTIKASPTCFTPQNVVAAATSPTSANVSWAAPSGGTPPTGYQYVVSTTSTPPAGAGTPIAGTSTSVTTIANTTYYAYVRTNCGSGGFSDWTQVVTFTTPCEPSSLTQNQGFNANAMPSCWAKTMVTPQLGFAGPPDITFPNAGNTSDPSCTPYEGNRLVKFNSFDSDFSQMRLSSLPMNTTGVPNVDVDFAWLHDDSAYPTSLDNVQVQYSLNGGTSWANAGAVINRPGGTTGTYWSPKTIQLPPATGNINNLMIGFLFTSDWGNNCYMDAVSISPRRPVAVNGQRCGPGAAICSATSASGVASPVFRWYTVETGGTAIVGQSTATLTGQNISANTTFYVSEIIGTAESRRTAVTATVNPLPVASATGSTVTCYNGNNGTATASASGGTSPYTYSWNTTPTAQTTITATNLTPATYTVTVTDNKTCTATANAVVNNANINTLPAVSTQPANATVCVNTNAVFTVAATGLAPLQYKWQEKIGSGSFINVNDGSMYSGTNTATLTLGNVAVGMSGNQYRCIVTGACSPAATSNAATLTVNQTLTAVSISSTANTICTNQSITFTATGTNPGTNPVYNWKINGGATVFTGNPFTYSSFSNGDVVTCEMSSNAVCPNPAISISTGITITVNPYLTPSVVIDANPGTTACAGGTITFTATPTNGGTTPSYQWMRNGNPEGPNNATYVASGIIDGDAFTCVLTSNYMCLSSNNVTSNTLNMSIAPVTIPGVTIEVSPNDSICTGSFVTFTATAVNEGAAPIFEWRRNGYVIPGATTGSTYTTNNLNQGDKITCELTSNKPCVNPTTAISNEILMNVNPLLVPSVSITATPDTSICTGTLATFTASPVNGGVNPEYQWRVNGQPMSGAISNTYSMTNINNGDIISCDMISKYLCPTASVVTSNTFSMEVSLSSPPIIAINVSPDNRFIQGQEISFSATAVNAGTAPLYKWKKNDVEISGATSKTYKTNTLANNDKITVTIISNNVCSNPDSNTSNAITMVDVTGVESIPGIMNDVTLYPNPNQGTFVIESEHSGITDNTASFEILNNVGQLVERGEISVKGGAFKHQVELKHLSSGTYFIRVGGDDQQIIKRFNIQQ